MPTPVALRKGETWTAPKKCTVKISIGGGWVRRIQGEDFSLKQGDEQGFEEGDQICGHPEGCELRYD
jgi:hypothetical protein